MKFATGTMAIVGLIACGGTSASAITADIAKTCRAQAIKAHPTGIAGSRSNYAEQQREAYRICVEQATNSGQPSSGDQTKK
jgi:hypothetical protein